MGLVPTELPEMTRELAEWADKKDESTTNRETNGLLMTAGSVKCLPLGRPELSAPLHRNEPPVDPISDQSGHV